MNYTENLWLPLSFGEIVGLAQVWFSRYSAKYMRELPSAAGPILANIKIDDPIGFIKEVLS